MISRDRYEKKQNHATVTILIIIALVTLALFHIAGCDEDGSGGGAAPTESVSDSGDEASPSPDETVTRQGASSPAEATSSAGSEWTILVYFGADCNLENPMLDNLRQIITVGSTSKVHVVLLADRSPDGDKEQGYSNSGIANLKNWKTAKVLYAEKGSFRELADWGAINLGEGKTLTRFLEYGMKTYPAKKTMVLFSDHGGAWWGVNADENPDSAMLSLEAIQSSLKKVTARYGRLEVIGFDACLMGNLEVAQAIAPYGRFMVASEETEPSYGWSFVPVLKALKKNPSMSGSELGRIIVDSYQRFFSTSDDEDLQETGAYTTLAVISLDKIKGVCGAMGNLSKALKSALSEGGEDSWKRISRARSKTEEYGTDSQPADSYNVLDLAQFASLLKKSFKGGPVGKAAEELTKALDQAIIYSAHGDFRPHASGISLYFPPTKKIWKDSEGYRELSFNMEVPWASFIDDYMKKAKKSTGKKAAVKSSDKAVEKSREVTVTSSVDPGDCDKAYFMLARKMGKKQIIMGLLPTVIDEGGNLREEWDGRWFTLEDKEQSLVCPVTAYEEVDEAAGRYLVYVPARVRLRTSKKWLDVTMHFDFRIKGKESSGRLISVMERTKFGPREIDLQYVSDIRPVYIIIDEGGTERSTSSEEEEDTLKIDRPSSLKVGWERVPSGMYLVGFRIDTLSGESINDSIKVKVK